jgi:hypothetical protein
VEQALKNGISSAGVQMLTGGQTSYTTTVSSIGSQAGAYAFPARTTKGDAEMLWLVNHNADETLNETPTYTANSIDVCWSSAGSPALAVIVLFKRGASYLATKAAYDPDATRLASNNFASAGNVTNGCGKTNVYKQTVSFAALPASPAINPATDTILAVRFRPIYADADIAISTGGVVLPSQGNTIVSVGQTGTGVTRKIAVTEQYRSPPSIFDAAVVSQTSFSH